MDPSVLAIAIASISGVAALLELTRKITTQFLRRTESRVTISIGGVKIAIDLSNEESVERAVASLTAAKRSEGQPDPETK